MTRNCTCHVPKILLYKINLAANVIHHSQGNLFSQEQTRKKEITWYNQIDDSCSCVHLQGRRKVWKSGGHVKVSRSWNKIVEPVTSPKKQMEEFVFLSWRVGNKEVFETKRTTLVYYVLWHYWLWSFNTRDTKLEIFFHKNQHTQRKLLNFENWTLF